MNDVELEKALLEYNVDLNQIYPYPYNGNNGKLWIDTIKFSPAAQTFTKYGYYFPPEMEGTLEHIKFWDEEERRIKEGFVHPNYPDQWITGLHYLYLNYCRIKNKVTKKMDFPDFWDLDADYFKRLDEARSKGLNFVATKARQRGFSLKDMVPPLYAFNFEPASITYIGSYLKTHANKSWIFLKNYLNHINKYTDFYKERNPDTKDYIRAAFYEELENGKKIESGYLSEVYKLCFEDDPSKGVGGAVDWFIYEEAGVSPTLKETIDYILSNIQAGSVNTGFIIAYGSVGDMDKSKDLEEYFYNPEKYGFYGVNNIWGSGGITGYFVPEYICHYPHIDKEGNSKVKEALVDIIKRRDKEKTKSTKDYNMFCSQRPITDQEAFASRTTNKFPIVELKKRIVKLLQDPKLTNKGFPVEFTEINKSVKFIILSPEYNKINIDWPIKEGTNNTGIPWIYELPQENTEHLYIASLDTVDQGIAETSNSLQSIYIYKKDDGKLNTSYKRKIVFSYIGRTEDVENFYKQALLAMRYYNAIGIVENHNIGFINYCKMQGYNYILQDQMDEIQGLAQSSSIKRSKGYAPTVPVIRHGDELIAKYLNEVIDYEYNDKKEIIGKVLGLERLDDIGLLRELVNYNPTDNFDRLVAFRGLLLYEEASYKKEILVESGKTPFEQLLNINKYTKKYKQFN